MKFTKEQQLANVILAQQLWAERVNPDSVVGGLKTWTCGTQACFGGHCATWPEFQALGVKPTNVCAPKMFDEPDLHPMHTGVRLFGGGGPSDSDPYTNANLFAERGSSEIGTDYEVVVKRLQKRRAELEEALRAAVTVTVEEARGAVRSLAINGDPTAQALLDRFIGQVEQERGVTLQLESI